MTLQILGSGCPKCQALERSARQAVSKLQINAEIEKITDVDTMMEMGMMVSPGFAIDGTLLHTGKVLTSEQIERAIQQRMENSK